MNQKDEKTKSNKERFNIIYDMKFKPASSIYKEAGQDLNKTIFIIFGSFISTALLFKEEFRRSVEDNHWVSLVMIAGIFITVLLFFIHKVLQIHISKNIMKDLDNIHKNASLNWKDAYLKKVEDVDPYEKRIWSIGNFTSTLFLYYISFSLTFISVAVFIISSIL